MRILLPLLLLACFVPAARAERLPLKSYTTADGLPNNVINKIVRDSRGFLWFCTAEGLSLFDGYRFTNYGTGEGLPHINVTDILETRAGDYWVATNGGLSKFNPRGVPGGNVISASSPPANATHNPMFAVYTPEGDDRFSRSVTTLLEGRDGTIWCGTVRGLYRLTQTGGHTTLFPVDIGLPTKYPLSGLINALLEDRYGTLWVGAATGLYRRWPDGSSARYDTEHGLPDDSLHDLLEDRQGNLWVGTRHGGLFRLATGVGHEPPVITRSYNRKNGLTTDWVFGMHESPDGKLWVGTNLGLIEFSPGDEKQAGPSHVYTRRHGFTYHEITNVTEDREGNLWLGTATGAMKIARNGFLTFGEQDGIYSVNAIFESRTGEIYAYGHVLGDEKATVFDGAKVDLLNRGAVRYWPSLAHFDGERFEWVWPTALRGANISWSDKPFVIQAHTGEWWIGTYLFPRVGSFTELKTARPLTVYTTPAGDAVTYSIYEDSRGDVWISTASSAGNGLARWDRATRSVRDIAGTEGLPPLKEILPVSFQEDAAGNIWVGLSAGGLARYAAGRFEVFTVDDGLPPGRINDLYLDLAGRLWIATSRGGLGRLDDPTAARPSFTNYSTAHGLSSNSTNAVTEDLYGRIYVATGRGLDRIIPATGQTKHFTTADGLASGEIVTAFRDRRGALWFGTTQGLSRFAPEPDQPSLPPPILISGLRLAGNKHTVSALGETEIILPELAAAENQLQIDFVGLSFASGETLRYQHRLEGADTDWSAPTEQRTVNYASLSPGRYRFLVRAMNSEGVSSPRPASITFTILRPIWQRWWFLGLAALVLAALAYAAYRYRVARLVEIERVRTRIATDLHDDIGANLTHISLMSELAKQERGNESLLTSIADIARESVSSMNDIVWAISPEHDRLLDLTRRMRQHAEEIFALRDINLEFKASAIESEMHLRVGTRRDVLLIFKEAVNNVTRHSDCTEVSIDFRAERHALRLLIRDNGRGFEIGSESDGHGLLSMTRRAAALGGKLKIDSRVGEGTTVQLELPLPNGSRI